MQIVIPFSGFYNTWHGENLDYAENFLIRDNSGMEIEGLCQHLSDGLVIRSKARQDYAGDYAACFCQESGVKLKFLKVDSPREYNFESDRIFCTISVQEVARLMREVESRDITAIAAQRHSSRSGFISFYSPNWRSWGAVSDWAPEQLHTLLLAWLRTKDLDAQEIEREIEEKLAENATRYVDSSLTEKGTRIANIASYLRVREERRS